MGFFGAYQFIDGEWSVADPDLLPIPAPARPWMHIAIHDSDIAVVRYQPRGVGTGEAFLGTTPRTYFGDPEASAPTDPSVEAVGLAAWTAATTSQEVAAATIQPFLARDAERRSYTDDTPDDDIFVEIETAQFLSAIGLPLPADLRDDDEP